MKNYNILSLIALIGILLLSSCKEKKQTPIKKADSIAFTTATSFEELLKKAQKEDKLIFIDSYTDWCAPCKWMDKNIFTRPEVYNFYNKNFINLKLDMEKGEGPRIGKKYGVNSYPTYLFIDGNGKLIHFSKSKMGADSFIEEGKKALDPHKAIGILADKLENGTITDEELLNYAINLNTLRDPKTKEVYDDLISTFKGNKLRSKEGWRLIKSFVYSDTTLQKALDKNRSYYESTEGKSKVNKIYAQLLQRKMNQTINKGDKKQFHKELDSLKKLSNNYRNLAILESQFYLKTGDSKNFIKQSDYYVNNHLNHDAQSIAFIARSALNMKKDNKAFMTQASKLIEKAYRLDSTDYGIVSTYSQIQNEVGNKPEAIRAAKLAVRIADTITSKIERLAKENLARIEDSNKE